MRILSLFGCLCFGAAASGTALRAEPAPALRSLGSDAMEGVMKRWASRYFSGHPGGTLAVANGTMSAGLRALAEGRADFCPSGRAAWPEEIQQFVAVAGYQPLRVTVARCTVDSEELPHPHAVFVPAENPLTRLTLTQVDAIFSQTRRRGGAEDIATWGQLGLTGEWANQPIHLYGVVHTKGPSHFFSEQALLDGKFKDSLIEVSGEESVLPKLATDRYGIAYTGLPFHFAGVKHLAIAERAGAPYSDGSRADIIADRYPLARVIYVSVNRPPGRPLPSPVKAFLELALSPEGQRAAAVDGYLPLSPAQVAAELARL